MKRFAILSGVAALVAVFATGAALIVSPGVRSNVFGAAGGVLDWIVDDGGQGASEIKGSMLNGEPRPVSTASLAPVVFTVADGEGADGAGDDITSPCSPRPDLHADAEPMEIRRATLDELKLKPNPEEAIAVLDTMLGELRDGKRDHPWLSDEKLLSRAAAAGSGEALVLLGDLIEASDNVRALQFYQRAASMRHASGMMAMADRLWNGAGVEKAPDDALRLYQSAAEAGDVRALETLAHLQLNGEVRAGESSARELLERAVEAGSSASAASLGVLYLNGFGVGKDPRRAAGYFEKAALGGDLNGMLYFARCLNAGIGVTRNTKASRRWFRKAAKAGNEQAVAWCQRNGEEFGSF